MNKSKTRSTLVLHSDCQLIGESKFNNYKGIRGVTKLIKKLTFVSESYARHSLCFRTNASIKSELDRQLTMPGFVIHPFSHLRFYWEFFMFYVYLGAFFFLPFEACNIFYTKFNPGLFINYGIPMACFHSVFLLDMVLNFFTGYIEIKRKKIILEQRQIIIKYLKTFFLIDLLATIPALMNAVPLYFGNGKPMHERTIILNFLKMFRLMTYTAYGHRICHRFGFTGLVYRITRFLLRSLFFFHWAACLLFVIPFTFTSMPITLFSANTWMHSIRPNISELSITRFYLSSLFVAINKILSCAAMTKPHSPKAFITSACYAVLGVLYTCYLFVEILNLVRLIMEPGTKYDEFITQLRDYMRHNQLPSNIQQRMFLFYEHRYQRTYFLESAIINTLSERMKENINDYGKRSMLAKTKEFKRLSPEVLEDIVAHFVLKIYLPKDVICKARSPSRYVYFLYSGTVAVYTASGKEVCHLHDGQYFGELSLLMKDRKMIANITALEICKVYVLENEIFLRAMRSKPEMYKCIIEVAMRRIRETRAVEVAQRAKYEENRQNASEAQLV